MGKKLNKSGMHSPKAQGMVEFALALPVFLLLVFGVIEFGRLLVSYSSVYTASREAARFGAAVGDSGAGVPYFQDCTGIRQAAMRVGALAGVQEANVVVRYYRGAEETTPFASFTSSSAVCNVNVELGYLIAVEVTVTYRPIVPLVNLPQIPITSVSSRTIVQGVDIFGTPGVTMTARPSSNTATITPSPTNTLTPSPTASNTPLPTATPSITPTPVTPTTTDVVQQTAIEGAYRTATKIQETIDAWNTAVAAQTLTAAPLKTAEAALTQTASSLTKTAAADCTWIVAGSGSESQNKYTFNLNNTSLSRNASITKIYLDWTAKDTLTSITFGASVIWTGSQAHPATLTTWDTGVDLTLNSGAGKTMILQFSGNNPQVQRPVLITFDNGCPAVPTK